MADQIEKYSDEVYQLDYLISSVYNFVYAKNGKNKIKFMDTSDLKLSRFKLYDYNLDVIFDKTRIQYVGNYSTGIKINGKNIEEIWFKRKGETYMSTIRIIPYIDNSTINDMTDPINVNQIVRTLLSELVINERTSNILLPIINVDVENTDLTPYNKVAPLTQKNKFYSVEITERFYSLKTLDEFLKEFPLEMRVLKSIIYQAVDVLYQINISYPAFRYNQLFPEMINCYLKENNGVVLPELKLSNFYLSEIGEIIQNSYLKNPENSIPKIDSSYSDLYQLLNYMWNNVSTDIKKYPELVSLFEVILPQKIRSNDLYLSKELWDKLTEEEKFDLRIKNIRNNTSFTSKDSLLNTTFVESNNINDESSSEDTNEPLDENINEFQDEGTNELTDDITKEPSDGITNEFLYESPKQLAKDNKNEPSDDNTSELSRITKNTQQNNLIDDKLFEEKEDIQTRFGNESPKESPNELTSDIQTENDESFDTNIFSKKQDESINIPNIKKINVVLDINYKNIDTGMDNDLETENDMYTDDSELSIDNDKMSIPQEETMDFRKSRLIPQGETMDFRKSRLIPQEETMDFRKSRLIPQGETMDFPNKKYSNNDIDNMSNKNSKRNNISGRNDFSDTKRNNISSRNDFSDTKRNNSSSRYDTDRDNLSDIKKRSEASITRPNSDNLSDTKKRSETSITRANSDDRYGATNSDLDRINSDRIEETEENTEDRRRTRPSRIINIQDTQFEPKKSNKNKLKTYQGRRRINGTNNTNNTNMLMPDTLNYNGRQSDNQIPYDFNNNNLNNNLNINGVPSRINSIGSLLGASTNDYNNRDQNTNYSQMAQQMAQQFQYDPNQAPTGHLPSNMSQQIPMPIQNPVQQTPMMQPNNDAIYRYLSASGQMPSQNQVDPNMLAYMMQQNGQMPQMAPAAQALQQMPSIPQQTLPQMGGGKRNPFFFQQ